MNTDRKNYIKHKDYRAVCSWLHSKTSCQQMVLLQLANVSALKLPVLDRQKARFEFYYKNWLRGE